MLQAYIIYNYHAVLCCMCLMLCYSSILFIYMMNGCLPVGYLHNLVLHCHSESNDGYPLLKIVCVIEFVLYHYVLYWVDISSSITTFKRTHVKGYYTTRELH